MYLDEFSAIPNRGPPVVSVWAIVRLNQDNYRNVAFDPPRALASHGEDRDREASSTSHLLRPRCDLSRLALWRELYYRDSLRYSDAGGPSPSRETVLEDLVLELQRQIGAMVQVSAVKPAVDIIG